MSDCLETLSAKPLPQPTDARAARLEKFRREQRIVEYLNRGVSVAEIAAQVGVGEKRLRAIIRDPRTGIRGLARRMPHPPEPPDPSPGVVAIQMSRLNEALLVAYSAMSPSNLKAVDQVVKIVPELDRYGGAFAAEWARPAASRLDAPAEEDVAFAKAWLSDGELEQESSDDRPENLAQSLEKVESTPGNPLAPPERGEGRGRLAAALPPPLWGRIEVGGRANFGDLEPWGIPNWQGGATPHPVLPPQEPAPGRAQARPGRGKRPKSRPARQEMCASLGVNREQERPENPTQSLEKVEIRARDWVELPDRRGCSSRPGLRSRPHAEPVEERRRSPRPPRLLEQAAPRHVSRSSR